MQNETVTGCFQLSRSCLERSLRTFWAWITSLQPRSEIEEVRPTVLTKEVFKNVCLLTSIFLVTGVYWCFTIYLSMIKKKYIRTIYHLFVACAFIFSDLQKKKNRESLSSEPMLYKTKCTFSSHPLVPTIAAAHGFCMYRSIWLNNVTVCTVHYSLVGNWSMLCAPGLWGTLAVNMVLSVFPTLLFL